MNWNDNEIMTTNVLMSCNVVQLLDCVALVCVVWFHGKRKKEQTSALFLEIGILLDSHPRKRYLEFELV